jgi:hypothetical protein
MIAFPEMLKIILVAPVIVLLGLAAIGRFVLRRVRQRKAREMRLA